MVAERGERQDRLQVLTVQRADQHRVRDPPTGGQYPPVVHCRSGFQAVVGCEPVPPGFPRFGHRNDLGPLRIRQRPARVTGTPVPGTNDSNSDDGGHMSHFQNR